MSADGSHDYSIPHDCKQVPKRKQAKPGTGLVGPGKLVIWHAGLGLDHYEHPQVYDLVAATTDEMMAKVAAHVGMDVAELERRYEQSIIDFQVVDSVTDRVIKEAKKVDV